MEDLRTFTQLSCRVCLQDADPMVPLFDEDAEDVHANLSAILADHGGISVENLDNFPRYLCTECTSELLITAKFREKCAKTQEILQKIKTYKVVTSTEGAEDRTAAPLESEVTDGLPRIDAEDTLIIDSTADQVAEEIVEASDSLETNPDDLIVYEFQKVNPVDANEDAAIQEDVDVLTVTEEAPPAVDKAEEKIFVTNLKRKLPMRFMCEICGFAFSHAHNLRRHLRTDHAPEMVFTCPKCQHCFISKNAFVEHNNTCQHEEVQTQVVISKRRSGGPDFAYTKILRNTGKKEENRCRFCNKEAQSRFALQMHERIHTGERPFACEYCIKSFKTQSALKTHTKRHLGSPDYMCTVCNKTFYETSNLKLHMLVHTGEKPHVCQICNRAFARIFLLQQHLRVHSGERPFQCNICSRSFKQSSDLHTHEKRHTNDRPHKCTMCGKAFIKRSALYVHIRKRHSAIDWNSGEEDEEAVAEEAENEEDVVVEKDGNGADEDEFISQLFEDDDFYGSIIEEVV